MSSLTSMTVGMPTVHPTYPAAGRVTRVKTRPEEVLMGRAVAWARRQQLPVRRLYQRLLHHRGCHRRPLPCLHLQQCLRLHFRRQISASGPLTTMTCPFRFFWTLLTPAALLRYLVQVLRLPGLLPTDRAALLSTSTRQLLQLTLVVEAGAGVMVVAVCPIALGTRTYAVMDLPR